MVQAAIRLTAPPTGERISRRAPRKAPWRRPPGVSTLLELGMIDEVEARIASATDRLDALTWANMRSLLLGHRGPAETGIEKLRELARTSDDREPWERYWIQRFWAAFEWGSRDERLDVLEHCRERAYRFDELHWWANLTLLLAATGTYEEAFSAFDETHRFVSRVPKDLVWLDELTNLNEAAALLGDTDRLAACHRALRWPDGRVVVVGNGLVCKGSVDRSKALGYAALGRDRQADRYFRRAETLHLEIGAGPLLVRTRQQAGGSLISA